MRGTPEPDNVLKILLATDNHLGVWEKCPIRKNDSFRTFEEVFKLAQEKEVDLVLLGGDIFHENKPSRDTMVKAIQILRKYTLGDRPVSFRVLNNAARPFQTADGAVNLTDPCVNVGLPVFTVHGNHDDPSGEENLSAIDILAACNLVNYFGKTSHQGTGQGRIDITPVLIEKGITRLALYGLGYMRDERLCRAFQAPDTVFWQRCDAGPGYGPDDFFSIFVVHQNREKYGAKNFVPEKYLPGFLDIVLWGHEHESLPELELLNEGRETRVCQLGSTVVTALQEGESKPKHCMLLEVGGDAYRATKIQLKTCRPFVYDTVTLADAIEIDPDDPASLEAFLAGRVNDLVLKGEALAREREGEDGKPMLPLVRLRVDYTGFSTINSQRFGQRYVDRVANPHDVLLWTKKRTRAQKGKEQAKQAQGASGDLLVPENLRPEALDQATIERLISEHLQKKLEILPESDLGQALHEFVDKDEKGALQECVDRALLETREAARKVAAQDVGDVGEVVTAAVQLRAANLAVSGRHAPTAAPSIAPAPAPAATPSAPARTHTSRKTKATTNAVISHMDVDMDGDGDGWGRAAGRGVGGGGDFDDEGSDDLMEAAGGPFTAKGGTKGGRAKSTQASQAAASKGTKGKKETGAGAAKGKGAGGAAKGGKGAGAAAGGGGRAKRATATAAQRRIRETAADEATGGRANDRTDTDDSDGWGKGGEVEEVSSGDEDLIEVDSESEGRGRGVGKGVGKGGANGGARGGMRKESIVVDSDDDSLGPTPSLRPTPTPSAAGSKTGGKRKLPPGFTQGPTQRTKGSMVGGLR